MNPRPIAIGCMRLSTDPDRDEERAVGVLHAAFDAGVTLLDTADVYCSDDSDIGHNERLIAQALRSWDGDRTRITVATKGGLTRPEGRWEPDGRARHLVAACERSCRALDVASIDLYQLHAVDPRTPLSTSVRALAALQRNGVIKAIGLSNVTVGQIEEARRLASIDAVQVELSVYHEDGVLSGVAEYCARHGIRLLAYRPLGGRKSLPRIAADQTLLTIAARHAVTPHEVALAWLEDLHPVVVALPGVTRVETVQSSVCARRIQLREDDRRLLDQQFRSGAQLRAAGSRPVQRRRTDAEVVMVMGVPAAGKTTLTRGLVEQGYQRLNRDEAGGSLRALLPQLEQLLAHGPARVVLDNTYITRASRAAVIRTAAEAGAAVHCKWLTTDLDDAQVNAVTRLLTKYGRLPDDVELSALRKRDVNAISPTVLFRYQRELEPPDPAEGFASIERVAFERAPVRDHVNRALIFWCDDPAAVVASAPGLQQFARGGWTIVVLSWQPKISEGTLTVAEVERAFADARLKAGVDFDLAYCPHGAGPPRCWCRKPLPGLGVLMLHRHRIDPANSIFVGNGPQDAGFARKLGLAHRTVVDSAP
ncbi:MAG TPA: aldo/keto reductase [Vicinamibacterales bacterium]|nr:aldo/keto reductase [Vicinamibacterales bacterium]